MFIWDNSHIHWVLIQTDNTNLILIQIVTDRQNYKRKKLNRCESMLRAKGNSRINNCDNEAPQTGVFKND